MLGWVGEVFYPGKSNSDNSTETSARNSINNKTLGGCDRCSVSAKCRRARASGDDRPPASSQLLRDEHAQSSLVL